MKPMLAKTYESQSVKGWLMSEKLDGVRAIWTGTEFVSRNGNPLAAPSWFTDQLPTDLMLDGELFMGRGQFQSTVGAVRRKTPDDAEWGKLSFMVFDAPDACGGFEARLAAAAAALAGCGVARIVEQTSCSDTAHLNEFFSGLVASGAEGVMLRAPGSAYEQKRSNSLLKYKPFDSDEAVVIAHKQGAGRLSCSVGALVCRWRDKIINVGSGLSDSQHATPPGIGAVVTFGFCGLTDGGIPRFPSFIGARDYE